VPRVFGNAVNDPAGSVSIIDMAQPHRDRHGRVRRRRADRQPLRLNTGMDFEPEYIAVNAAGTKAFVSVQEANGLAVLDLATGQFEKVVGLGAKDFNAPGNEIDSLNNSTVSFANVAAKGLYMPDAVATYEAGGRTFVVMANEGDFREDDGDRSAASTLGAIRAAGEPARVQHGFVARQPLRRRRPVVLDPRRGRQPRLRQRLDPRSAKPPASASTTTAGAATRASEPEGVSAVGGRPHAGLHRAGAHDERYFGNFSAATRTAAPRITPIRPWSWRCATV
jgi:hypothetical protein